MAGEIVGPVTLRPKVSPASAFLSFLSATDTLASVCPASKVSVPPAFLKSAKPWAEPSMVA